MAPNLTRSKPSILESVGTKAELYTSTLHALADPLKYDTALLHRLTNVLKNDPVASINPSVKVKRNAPQSLEASDQKRKFAMGAANAASQSLGSVIQSGWNASSNPDVAGFSTDRIRSIVSCFQLAISVLRELMPRLVDVERVVSSFIGKLIAIQFYEVSLELLTGLRMRVVQLYHEPIKYSRKPLRTTAKSPSLIRYMHLVGYPLPPPKDPALIGVIGTSLAQALIALATLVCHSPTNGTLLDAFASSIEEENSLLMWHSILVQEHADMVLARAHRTLAVTFTSSNTPPAVLFRLRTWALRCLLCKKTSMDPDPFWSQATNYLASHGRSVIKTEDGVKAVTDAVCFFDALVSMAQRREDTSTFMAGSSFIKFCEVALKFAQRGNDLSNVKRIVRFIKSDREELLQISMDGEISSVQLYATLSQGAAMLDKFLHSDTDGDLMVILTQCMNVLPAPPAIFSCLEPTSNTLRSLEKLRRLSGRVLEDARGGDELRNLVKSILEGIVESIEIAGNKMTMKFDLAARAVDSLCVLAKTMHSQSKLDAYTPAYGYLQRGVIIVNAYETSLSSNKTDPPAFEAFAKVLRCISGAFWNHAISLYQGDQYAAAVRFLVHACGLGTRACSMARDLVVHDSESGVGPTGDSWTAFKTYLPKRWELLGDCYIRIGDRQLAYEALIESIKTYSFERLRLMAASLSPAQISSEAAYSRLFTLVQRTTHIAVSDLCMTEKASLCHPLCTPDLLPEVVGMLLEWQVTGLEENLWDSERRSVVNLLLQDALRVYGIQFPIRRARVLLRELEFAYRIDDLSLPITDIAAEIHNLLSNNDNGKDTALSHFVPQYQAAAHMWMAFHAHRLSQRHSNTSINFLQQATSAIRILRKTFPSTPHPPLYKSPKHSPKMRVTQLPKAATRSSPRKRAATATTKINPTTPKPRKKIMQTPPRHDQSPKSTSGAKCHGSTVDPHIANTVEMFSQLLGLLGHVPLKIQVLSILQKIAEQSLEPSADRFIRASVDAAVQYLTFGKTRRALAIYAHALTAVNDAAAATISDDVRILLLLHYAEALALCGDDKQSIQLYEDARNIAQNTEGLQLKSTAGRIRHRVQVLQWSALASKVFSLIQAVKDGPHAALSSMRQSLRLWNRAFDSLARLSPTPERVEPNPFDMLSLAAALPHPQVDQSQKYAPLQQKTHRRGAVADSLQWRIAGGLLCTLFDLARAYFQQGFVRGAEYFIEQARDLAGSLNSPAMLSRAIARKSELQLHQGNIQDAATSLMEAAELLQDLPGVDAADITRLRARHSQLLDQTSEAKTLYLEALSMVSDLERILSSIDNAFPGPRKSLTRSPGRSNDPDVLAPDFLATVLKQQIWLQRNEPRTITGALLDRFSALPRSRHTKAEKLAILAKLALHDAHIQFRADLFLSSFTESTIAIPMGLSSHDVRRLSVGAKQILKSLSTAETMFWENLECISNCGHVPDAREAAISLALIQSFQTSLGKDCDNDARVAVGLLDASAAITLRRELIDVIDQKFPELAADDLIWPTTSGDAHLDSVDTDDDGDTTMNLKAYWKSVRDRYHANHDLDKLVSSSHVDLLPANWTVVNISITEDKSTMFFSRQRPDSEPLLFCVPLERHGRQDESVEDQFLFDDAMRQLRDILRESDQSAKDAKEVPSEDRDAKAAWWAKRVALDKQMQGLLDNIEFCWLGAFKTILQEPITIPPDMLSNLRARIDRVFHRILVADKKRASRMKLDDPLVECFASLSPTCRDEELEDLVYFILDLYQFHGLHIALSEIDLDLVTVELRTALEEHAAKGRSRIAPVKDAHLFLVLDKNVQGIPWESIPILRGKSVSRIPSLSFLLDRVEFAKMQRGAISLPIMDGLPPDRAIVDPKKTFYVLNPSGDLTKSEGRFSEWVKEMESVGWQGIVGRVPSEQELLAAFNNKDLVIYIGHGGAEQYVRSNKIKQLPRCAATMLWGCSSGLMRDMGDFDRTGTPYNYMMAGCPTLVACLWDVTDNELDKFSRSVFDSLRLDARNVKCWNYQSRDDNGTSLIAAVGRSRDVCKLKYLTGAAPVVYGIPFYL